MRFQAGLRVEKQLSLRKYVRVRSTLSPDINHNNDSVTQIRWLRQERYSPQFDKKEKPELAIFFLQARYITYAQIFFRVTLALLKKVPETLVWLEKRLSLMHKFELVEFNWIKRKLRAWQMTLRAFENKVLFSGPTVFNTV